MSHAKPLILLVPGLDGTGLLYEPQVPALEKHFRVLAFRFRSPQGFEFSDLVRELDRATAEEPAGSITVVGESFGGPVAIQYALAFPERVRRLVLINTFPYYRWRIRIRLACLSCPLLRKGGVRQIKDFLAIRLLRREGIDAAGLEHYLRVIRHVDLDAYRRRLELVRGVDLRPRLGEIRVPTLILASGADRIVPSVAEAHHMASRIAGAEVREFPRAGHALLLTPGFSLSHYVALPGEEAVKYSPAAPRGSGKTAQGGV